MKCDSHIPCARCSKLELECTYENTKTRSTRIQALRNRQSNTLSHEPPSKSLSEPDQVIALPHTTIQNDASAQVVDLTDDFRIDVNASAPDKDDTATTTFSNEARPSHLQRTATSLSVSSQQTFSGSPRTASVATNTSSFLAGFSQQDILPWINVFLDRLYLTLPIVNRTTLYQGLILGRQHENADFASMVLSLCALSMIQPVLHEENDSMPARLTLATSMLQSAISIRHFDFGESTNVEGVIASFFMFATFFGMGYHKTAWLRLRESVECGKLIGLYSPKTYHSLDAETKGQRFRLLLILAVTERGYALQRNHSISITGKNMHDMKEMYLSIGAQAMSKSQGIYIHDDKDIAAVHGLLQLMRLFDAIDEDVIPCWNRSCAPTLQTCQKLTINHVEKVYHSIAEALTGHGTSPWPERSQALTPVQYADCFVLQQWLLMRLWVSCLTHDLLDGQSLSVCIWPSFVLDIAEKVNDECQVIGSDILEIHGSGMIERIHDIGMGVIMAAQGYDEVLNNQRTTAVVDSILQLLRQFRNQERPFLAALEDAYHSVLQ